MNQAPLIELGVKTDPIEYRYSYDWLFRLMAEEGIHHVQVGTFFEIYQLPDAWFRDLAHRAADHGLTITSMFTAHRELGGFFREDPAWVEVARRNYERYIEVGGILGARSVGSNPGAVMRDLMGLKPEGVATYVNHMKELLHHAARHGVEQLTIEPMSCLAEPPTLPDEMREMIEALDAHHAAHPGATATAGLCLDVSHGYADAEGNIIHGAMDLLEAGLPYTTELHFKNTDALFNSTFGFGGAERERGIIDLAEVRSRVEARRADLRAPSLVGYLEIGGPKLGRDYSDGRLEEQLRESLRHLKEVFEAPEAGHEPTPIELGGQLGQTDPMPVLIAPSMMCADTNHLEASVRRLESAGCDWLHLDVMDGRFVPNMPLGLETIKALRPITALPLDVHLMVEDNDWFIERIAPMGVDWISVHQETACHLDRTLALIRSHGIKAGVALNPATPLQALDYVTDHLDYLLIMTVNPGYAGQKMVPSALRKIADARAWLDRHGLEIPIQVDGNVSFENIPAMVAAGGDILVAGTSSVFHKDGTLRANTTKTREVAAEGLKRRSERDAA